MSAMEIFRQFTRTRRYGAELLSLQLEATVASPSTDTPLKW